MKTFFKIITFPIWFPIKMLWLFSKIVAFIFIVLLVAAITIGILWQQGIIFH